MFAKCAVLVALLFASAAWSCDVEFTGAEASIVSPKVGSAYATIVSKHDDKLIGLKSSCCEAVELHKNIMEDGVMKMRKLDSVELKAGQPLVLSRGHDKPESMHLMLIGLKQTYQAGEPIVVTMQFAEGGRHDTLFYVAGIDGKAPKAPAHTHQH